MFKLLVANIVTFLVKGSMPDAKGNPVPFSFSLTADRMDVDELQALTSAAAGDTDPDAPPPTTVIDVLKTKVHGWADVKDDDGAEVPFSAEGLAQLLRILGMAGVCYTAYLQACGARGKEKN